MILYHFESLHLLRRKLPPYALHLSTSPTLLDRQTIMEGLPTLVPLSVIAQESEYCIGHRTAACSAMTPITSTVISRRAEEWREKEPHLQ